jgi:hypothetical protein
MTEPDDVKRCGLFSKMRDNLFQCRHLVSNFSIEQETVNDYDKDIC